MMKELPTPEDIEKAAAEHGLTMKALYAKAGINKTTFWRWKRGENITLDKVKALMDALE